MMEVIGAALSLLVGLAAWRLKALTPSGVVGAVVTGTLIFAYGGWAGAFALLGFFLSSSLLSRLFRRRKARVEEEYAKTGRRDLGQALANGGVAAIAALLLGLTGDRALLGAVLGALAAANGDTWATELGVLSPTAPRMITSLRIAPAGTSGAVSAIGLVASLAGAAFVGLAGALADPSLWLYLPAIAFAGMAGSISDSLLGATLQAVYVCNACGRETERQIHRCGLETELLRGWPWLGNDLVNLLATVVGGLIGYVAFR